MPILNNQFTCSNGHSFEANAKIRARCPECGVTARRNFTPKEPEVPKVESKEPKHPAVIKKPVLLKQGRPRLPKVVHKSKTPVKTASRKVVRPAVPPKVASAGLVKQRRITTRGVIPTVKKRPVKTAVARGIKGQGQPRSSRPFWHEVADRFGF